MSDFWEDDVAPVAPQPKEEAKAPVPTPSSFWGEELAATPTIPAEKDLISKLSDKLRATGMSLGESANDAGLGAVSGATFGFPDEIEGAGKAVVDSIQTGQGINPLNPEFMKKYRAYQKEADKKYKEADERSPWLYGAGNIVGGVATAPLTGAAGLASTGGRLAVKEALKSGGKMAAAKTATVEAGKDAALSFPAGALYGAGNSEGGVDTAEGREKLKSDTVEGGVLGSILGGGIGLASTVVPTAASSAVQGMKNYVNDEMNSPLSRIIKKSYKYGDEGINLSDHEVQNKVGMKANEYATEFRGMVDDADEMFGKEVGKTIDDAEAMGQKINVDETLSSAAEKIGSFIENNRNIELDPKSKEIIGRILTLNSTISPSEARHIRKQFKVLQEKYAGREDVSVPLMDALRQVQSGLKEGMDNFIPGYKEAAQNFASYRQKVPEQILSGHLDPRVTGIKVGKLKNPELDLQQSLEKMVAAGTSEGSAAMAARKPFFVLREKLLELQKTNPEAFKAMGKDAETIIRDFSDAADTQHMLGAFQKSNPHEGFQTATQKAVTGIMGTGKATMVGVANKAGLYGPKIVDKMGAPLRLTKKAMFDLPLESVGAVANHLAAQESQAIRNLGEALQKSVANKDAVGKNAVLFSIMQNPNTRKLLDLEDDDK